MIFTGNITQDSNFAAVGHRRGHTGAVTFNEAETD